MGKVIIQDFTTKNPISMIGVEAGVCWGADTSNQEKNYKRGMGCLESGHGRTFEFPDVYMILDGYSARVIREFYTHIGGSPTRLQASTRYIDYESGFDAIYPSSIKNCKDNDAWEAYINGLKAIGNSLKTLDACGIPKEDSANLLPLGMTTKIVVKINARTLMDMSRQRMCNRAYWEFRELFKDICGSLSAYSEEWKTLVTNHFMAKCDVCGFCTEEKSCGRRPSKEEFYKIYNFGKKIFDAIEHSEYKNASAEDIIDALKL